MELNREQIIKALECCLVESNCTGCPLHHQYETDCLKYAGEKALSLIKELTEDNEAQAETITNLIDTIKNVSGVKEEYEAFIGGLKPKIDEIRADTVRKMQERLNAQKFTHKNFGELVYVDDIDKIAKEMLEGL